MDCKTNTVPLFSLSISHKQAPLEIRGLFAFTKEEQTAFLKEMMMIEGIDGAVLVSTCNRTEVYCSGTREAAARAEEFFAHARKADLHFLRRYFRTYQGQQAMHHLFYVISGLDSMVIGEDEILGQMRDAYKLSCELGFADYYINAVFQKALGCAKQIKTETCLSKSSVSVATLCAAEITRFQEGKKRVLLLGAAGQIGNILLKNLLAAKDVFVYATVRKHHPFPLALPQGCTTDREQGEADGVHEQIDRQKEQADRGRLLAEKIKEIPYEKRYEYMDLADVVVSATKSPHYTITYDACKKALHSEKKRLFIDLAIPCDMDPDIGQFDNVSFRNIDYFDALAREHNEQKLEAVSQAREMIAAECDETAKELLFHSFMPQMNRLEACLGNKTARQMIFAMKEAASQEELEVILAVLGKI